MPRIGLLATILLQGGVERSRAALVNSTFSMWTALQYNVKMNYSTRSGYRHGAASDFVDRLRQRGRVSFPLPELEGSAGLSTIAARRQLARLGTRVTRVAPRQEFFLIIDPEHRAFGAPPPAWWLDSYFRWLERPYYLALQSAAAEYGSTAQAIQVTQVMTDRPRREIELGRLRLRFFVKRATATTPKQALAQAHAPLLVSTPAATIIDLVRYASRVGGIARAAETFLPLLGRLDHADFARALEDVEIPTLQRLGYLFERLGRRSLANTVHARLPRALRPVPLELPMPVDDSGVTTSERWSVRVNAAVED